MKLRLIPYLASLLIFSACTGNSTGLKTESNGNTVEAPAQPSKSLIQSEISSIEPESGVNIYSLEEISQHSSPNDCWFAIHDKVYDATPFVISAHHPGGDAILAGCGKDATTLFETRPMGSGTPHTQEARDLIQSLYIGNLEL